MDPKENQSKETLEQKKNIVIDELKQLPIINDMLLKLRAELPKNLKYHAESEGEEEGITHTEDVLNETILFAVADGISDKHSLELLGIMTVFHDAGFLVKYTANEPEGAKMAVEAMRATGNYSEEDCKLVSDGIEATAVDMIDGVLKQRSAPNTLSGYLLDGDLSNFGREDFRHKSDLVFAELQLQNPDRQMDKTAFLKATLGFILNHEWNTTAARNSRSNQQLINAGNLGREVGQAA